MRAEAHFIGEKGNSGPQMPYIAAALHGPQMSSKRGTRAIARRLIQGAGHYDSEEMRRDSVNHTDSLTVAFARELDDVIKEVFEVEYPELRAEEFLPVRGVSPEALTFTYRMYDHIAAADFIAENGSNIPKVDIKGEETQQPITMWGASYDFTMFDQMRSGRLGIQIDSLKAEAARWACEYKQEQLACVGDSAQGLVGLINAPGVVAAAQQSTGTWLAQIASIATATTTNATPPAVVVAQAIAGDIGYMISQIATATLGIHRPDTLLLPTQLYTALDTVPQSPGFNSNTLLDFLRGLFKGLTFDEWPQLNAADTAGTNGVHGVVVCYKRDPKIVNLMTAMPFTQLPPEKIKLAWEVNCIMRGGAAQVRYPLAVTYMKGLG